MPMRAEVDAGIKSGCPLVLDVFLEHGADVTELDAHGSSLLHGAAHRGQAQMAALLLGAGCAVDARNKLGRTPLHLACSSYAHYRKGDTVRLLVERGADIDARDAWGLTPLHRAVQSGDQGAILLLAEEGAAFDARDDAGETPLGRLQRTREARAGKAAQGAYAKAAKGRTRPGRDAAGNWRQLRQCHALPPELDLAQVEALVIRLMQQSESIAPQQLASDAT